MSSTSVEQARERSYHRALLLSKDKDTGENIDRDVEKCASAVLFTCQCFYLFVKLYGDVSRW